ncbi:MAG TPA: hypothetical protein VGA32_07620 [Anaerolineales bacterium]
MYSRPWRALFVGLLLIGALAAVAYYGYQAGIVRGLAEGASVTTPESGVIPVVPYAPYFYPHAFGFGPLGCLIPFLFFFLFFGLFRGLFWGGRWGWGHGHWRHEGKYGPEGPDVPPMFREWHRRAHEREAGEPAAPQAPPA